MYKTWSFSGADAETVARALEAHLNEFASQVISVSYSVDNQHHVLAVYREIMITAGEMSEEAVSVAETIIDGADG